jgi:hypothetical protein
LWLSGQLQTLPTWKDDGVRQVLIEAARQKWNIRIAERYRHGRGVVKYLARYVRGGPIKDHRLAYFDEQQVRLWYGSHGEHDAQGKPRRQEVTLSSREFLARWSEHVPLPGIHLVRAWGLYASTQRRRLDQCRTQLPEKETGEEIPQGRAEKPDRNRPWEACPVCHQRMMVTQVLPRAGAPPRVEAWAEAA